MKRCNDILPAVGEDDTLGGGAVVTAAKMDGRYMYKRRDEWKFEIDVSKKQEENHHR